MRKELAKIKIRHIKKVSTAHLPLEIRKLQMSLSDANCTKICVYMSVVLLLSSLIYELSGFAYADLLGAAGLIYFSVSGGKEAFEKARRKEDNCCE